MIQRIANLSPVYVRVARAKQTDSEQFSVTDLCQEKKKFLNPLAVLYVCMLSMKYPAGFAIFQRFQHNYFV